MVLALLIHGVLGSSAAYFGKDAFATKKRKDRPVSLVILEPKEEKDDEEIETEEIEEEKVEEPDGQIVETPTPLEEKRPEEAEYVAEHDQTVDEETRTKTAINPEVVAPEFSKERKFQKADQQADEVPVDDPSKGAPEPAPNERFDLEEHGSLREFMPPSPQTNILGPDRPMAPGQIETAVAGAPQNDLLKERLGSRTQLNTKEYPYAGYLNRIRRQVNFYWQENLDNLSSSVRLTKPQYTTGIYAILNADGALEHIEITQSSRSEALDDALVRAFRMAGPFPNPPEGLIEKDGRIYLPYMEFTVQLSAARASYQGIDPRAGVQFPGILKSPR